MTRRAKRPFETRTKADGFVEAPAVLAEELKTFKSALETIIEATQEIYAEGDSVDDAVANARPGHVDVGGHLPRARGPLRSLVFWFSVETPSEKRARRRAQTLSSGPVLSPIVSAGTPTPLSIDTSRFAMGVSGLWSK